MLVLISVAVAYWVSSVGKPDLMVLFHVLLGTLMVATSASALNQWWEWRRDAMMPRTANRPLPARRLGTRETVLFATLTLLVGLAQLCFGVGWQALAWALFTWSLYVWVYTPLKAVTSWNTAVGALAGAMPVLIGWSAAQGEISLRAACLYLVLFLWQFPHFMAIAWMYRKQYARAGMKMMPVVDPSGRRTGRHAVLAAAALLPVTIILVIAASGPSAWLYLAIAIVLGVGQLGFAVAFQQQMDDRSARRLLRASLIYLPLLLLLMVWIPWS
jgi:protoheme IX farnesyltransferase